MPERNSPEEFKYFEIVLSSGGPTDLQNNNQENSSFSGDQIQYLRDLFLFHNVSAVESLLDLFKCPFEKKSSYNNVMPKNLSVRSDSMYFDIRVATITSYQGWNACYRNLRIFKNKEIFIALWGPIEGRQWNVPEGFNISYVTLPAFNLDDTIAVCESKSIYDISDYLFLEYLKCTIGHIKWSISVAINEGIREREQVIFERLAINEDSSLNDFWSINAKIGASINFLVISSVNIKFRFLLKPQYELESMDNIVKNDIEEIEESIKILRSSLHENYHLLSSISQKQQYKMIKNANIQDKIFQRTISLIAIVVAIPSVIISLYGASSKGITGMPGEGSSEALWYILYISTTAILIMVGLFFFQKIFYNRR
jgi:hypothetical protein